MPFININSDVVSEDRVSISEKLFEACKYFFPRLMFLNSKLAPQVHWGDIARALTNFPEELNDLSSKEFWDCWMARWKSLGDNYCSIANNTSLESCRRQAYRSAAACYHWAEFMYFSNTELKRDLRSKVKKCFRLCLNICDAKLFTGIVTFNRVTIPYYLIHPENYFPGQKTPCVIISNGLDSVTEVEVFSIAERFLEIGCSVLLFDGPGQGINVGINPVEIQFEKVVDSLLVLLHKFDDIDLNRLVFFGVSFGGYNALRVAKYMPNNFRCFVNLSGGPVINEFRNLPRRLKEDFKYAFMQKDDHIMQGIFDSLSLKSNEAYNVDILSVHGGRDDIFPLNSVYSITTSPEKKHDILIYKEESHVCLNYLSQYFITILEWVADKLNK